MLGLLRLGARRNAFLRYLFEDYALDTDRRELRHGIDVIGVAPQVFDLLVYLIRNRHRFVGKDELIAAVWNGRVITDTALTTRLYVARGAVGDTGGGQRLIKTLPRKGFQFVGPVREERNFVGTTAAGDTSERARAAPSVPERPSIAVLAFTNLPDDPRTDFIAEGGFAEDMVVALSKQRWLQVVSRNASFSYRTRLSMLARLGANLAHITS